MKPQPNIILITTDQQRYDATGLTGPSFLRTPHFNDLSCQGVIFNRAYADCPICVPARVGIMTGQTVFRHGFDTNGNTSESLGRANTLPTCMRGLGYQTAAIGKMHFGPERARHGFDEMLIPDDYYRQMRASGSPFQPMRHGLGQNELYAGMATVPEALTLTSWIAEQSVLYIRERRDPTVPFFLWTSFSKPHPPLDPPEPYYSMYRNCDIPRPLEGDWMSDERSPHPFNRQRQSWSLDRLHWDIIREARAAYYGLITQIDYNIGRILAALMDMRLFDDTMILYTSDHGEYLGDFRTGSKLFFHEPSAHIPMLIRLPRSEDGGLHGSACDALATHADILPTCVAAAGGTPPADCDGMDLVAVARGQTPPRDYLQAGLASKPLAFLALTDGRWKYMYYPEGPTEQLFDLQSDPHESRDLAGVAEFADTKRRLREELTRRQSQATVALKGGLKLCENGKLAEFAPLGDSVRDRRNKSWPGYHTDEHPWDVRH